MRYTISVVFVLLCTTSLLTARVTLPPVFADDMVLQQQTDVALWGKAEAGRKVTIKPSWSKAKVVVSSDEHGRWSARLATPQAGGPYSITFDDGEKCTLNNVLIGEVWICSGQSNMEMPMKGYKGQPVKDAPLFILNADPSVPIRSCNLVKTKSFEPNEECAAKWYEHTPEGVAEASAVAYFYARRLYETLNVPIGVINVSWGGTPIEAWMNPQVLADEFAEEISLSHIETRRWPEKKPYQAAGVLYNGMLHSLKGFTAKGFIWYKGCSNWRDPQLYKRLQPAFVRMLRSEWENDSMPFYFVQLAQYRTILPEFKWIQAQTLELIPYSGMATAHDVGEYSCIHPADKETVGDRLAFLALTKDYGFGHVDADTPVPVKFEFNEGHAVVTFKVGEMGLSPRAQDLDGFELAGEDKVFYPAKARLLSGDGKSIKVYDCPQVSHPVAVRYGMSSWCTPTLYNCSGIPASPFRSDNW